MASICDRLRLCYNIDIRADEGERMRIILTTLNSSFTHSSLALRYLRAAIEKEWPKHSLLEFQIKDDPRRILTELGRTEPDVVAFSCYLWNIEATLAMAKDLKAVCPHTRIVLGGPEVGARAYELLRQEAAIDYVVSGEGEAAFPALLRTIAIKTAPENVAGVYYRKLDGLIEGKAPEKLTVESIPNPYGLGKMAELENKIVYYESSRGCPFGCSYCLSGNDPLRFWPLTRVFAELRPLLAADIPLIKFIDRTFNSDGRRALEIMQFLLKERKSTRFHFEICADILSDELLSWLEQVPADIFQFEIGVQSLNPETLQAIRRRMHWPKLRNAVTRLKNAKNIHLHLDLIAGLPNQDWGAIAKSFDGVMALKPDMLQLGFLKVLPGTLMAAEKENHGLVVSASPPYEALASRWLSFAELNRLHTIEELLSYYYNSGLLLYSLPYLWEQTSTGSPFDWFDTMAIGWEKAGLHRVAHSREALFAHIEREANADDRLHDLLAIDRARMSPAFPATFKLPGVARQAWEDYLNGHEEKWQPRTYKQAYRSVFPVWIGADTARYLGAPPGSEVAVVDSHLKNITSYTRLPR